MKVLRRMKLWKRLTGFKPSWNSLPLGKLNPKVIKQKRKAVVKEGTKTEHAKDLLSRQSKRLEYEVKKAKETANGRVGRFYKMKEIIGGSNKPSQEVQDINHPITGELIVLNSEIKK